MNEDHETVEIGITLHAKINHWHAEHPFQPMVLTAEEVCELAGCDGKTERVTV